MLAESELNAVLKEWPAGQVTLRDGFQELLARAKSLAGDRIELVARPGVSYSFRGLATQLGRERPVVVLIDVIPFEADAWMVSVCFYADEITDPGERGDIIPDGLLGEDGYCFDVTDEDRDMVHYLKDRLGEAYRAASGG